MCLASVQAHSGYTWGVQGNFRARKREEFVFCPLECRGHPDVWILSGWDVCSGGLSRQRGVLSTDWKNGPDHLHSPFDLLMSLKSCPTYRKIQCHWAPANLERPENRPQALPAFGWHKPRVQPLGPAVLAACPPAYRCRFEYSLWMPTGQSEVSVRFW